MKDCNIESISAFIDGEMPESEAALLREHMQECPSCMDIYQDLSAIRDGFADLERLPPDTLAPGIMYKIGLGEEPSRTGRAVRSLVAVAACLIAVIVLSRTTFPNGQYDAPAENSALPEIVSYSGTDGGTEAGGFGFSRFIDDAAAEIAPRGFADEIFSAPSALAPEAQYRGMEYLESDDDEDEDDEPDEED